MPKQSMNDIFNFLVAINECKKKFIASNLCDEIF